MKNNDIDYIDVVKKVGYWIEKALPKENYVDWEFNIFFGTVKDLNSLCNSLTYYFYYFEDDKPTDDNLIKVVNILEKLNLKYKILSGMHSTYKFGIDNESQIEFKITIDKNTFQKILNYSKFNL